MAQEQAQLGLLPNPPVADTDVLGNQTPAAMADATRTGADTLASPDAALDTGRLPLSPVSGGMSLGRALSSPHLQKVANSTQKALKANPKLASQPGGWAKALVGGFIDAMGGGLGDAAAAGEPAPGGGGALTGIARTMQARGQRQAAQREEISKEKTQEGLRAETMMRIAALTRNAYRQEKADRDASHAEGNTFMNTLRKDNETQEDKDNVTQNQLNEIMKKDPDFWKTHTGRAVGEEPVLDGNGNPTKDKDGNPVASPLYAISKVNGARKHAITAAESKFIGDNAGDKLPEGTPLGLHEYDNVMVRASSANAAKKAIEKANDEDLADEKAHQLSADLNDVNIQHYMHMVPNEPLAGLNQARGNAEAHIAELDKMISAGQQKGGQTDTVQAVQKKRQDFVDQTKKIDNVLSGFNDKAREDYLKTLEERRKQTEVERHNKAEEVIKAAENSINNPKDIPMTPELKQKIDTLPAPQRAILGRYDTNTQSSLMKIAFGNGETELEKNFPSRLTKGAPGLNTQQALGVINQLNPNWSEGSYAIKQGMYKSATAGPMSKQSDSLNNFIGHAGQAKTIANKLFNSGVPKVFKSTINELSKLGYGTDATSLQEAISVVNGEFDNMVKSGYAPTADEVAAQNTVMNANSTVGQINAALSVMSHMAATRASTMDQHYKTATGDHFPNLINEDNQDAARALGIPVEKYYTGGRIGGSGNAPQMQNTQTGAQGKATAPKGAANPTPGKSSNGVSVWKMTDGTIQDAQGNMYDPQTGKPK